MNITPDNQRDYADSAASDDAFTGGLAGAATAISTFLSAYGAIALSADLAGKAREMAMAKMGVLERLVEVVKANPAQTTEAGALALTALLAGYVTYKLVKPAVKLMMELPEKN